MSPDDIYGSVAGENLGELREEVGHREVELQKIEVVTG